MDTILYTI